MYHIVQCDAMKRVMRTNETCSIHCKPFTDNYGNSNGSRAVQLMHSSHPYRSWSRSDIMPIDWNPLKINVYRFFLFLKRHMHFNALRNRHPSELS